MGVARPLALATLAAVAAGAPVRAWAPQTRIHMADQAVRLMPASLRLALERHRKPLLRGLLEPQLREPHAEHRPPWEGGTLDEEIHHRALELVHAVERAAPFGEIAARFGGLAHFVMDAEFPPGSSADGSRRYGHFVEFCESRREKFPLVFYGHQEPSLDSGSYQGFARTILERARREDRELARAYAAAGDPPDPLAFDDRSVPFAVASLAYSHTVTDLVRVWIAAWRQASGDLGRTPYLRRR
jgi:hypothetical protein